MEGMGQGSMLSWASQKVHLSERGMASMLTSQVGVPEERDPSEHGLGKVGPSFALASLWCISCSVSVEYSLYFHLFLSSP